MILRFLLSKGILEFPTLTKQALENHKIKKRFLQKKLENIHVHEVSQPKVIYNVTANIGVFASRRVLLVFVIYENNFPCGTYRDGKDTVCKQ